MPGLFDPLAIREVKFANRVFVSPMCPYSSQDGHANDWHFVHLGNLRDGGLIQQAGGPLAGRDFLERGEYPK